MCDGQQRQGPLIENGSVSPRRSPTEAGETITSFVKWASVADRIGRHVNIDNRNQPIFVIDQFTATRSYRDHDVLIARPPVYLTRLGRTVLPRWLLDFMRMAELELCNGPFLVQCTFCNHAATTPGVFIAPADPGCYTCAQCMSSYHQSCHALLGGTDAIDGTTGFICTMCLNAT